MDAGGAWRDQTADVLGLGSGGGVTVTLHYKEGNTQISK